MGRPRTFVWLLGAAAVGAEAAAAVRHVRRAHAGRRVAGGVLVGDPVLYDALSHRLLLGSLFTGIPADVAAVAPEGARVLEVGCGPGRLSILLAGEYDLDVTGLDLDPVMIERAGANDRFKGRRRASAVVPRRGCGLLGFPGRIVRPGGQHLVDAPLGRPGEGPGRDRAGAAPGRPGSRMGPPARGRTVPHTCPRPDRPHAWHSTARGDRDAMALALQIQAHPADRASGGR
jgi:hypothetical protein